MKGNDIKLIVVMVVAIVASGLCAKKLVTMQTTLKHSTKVAYASKMPLAGFQKFMADITWMRFLNYAGNNQLTDKNVDKYEYYIQRIIALDPDFYEPYKWGVLFLSQEDVEKALKIVDMAMTHPKYGGEHELPLLGGQLLMRPQWMDLYSGKIKKIDPAVARRAKEYYFAAKSANDATASCLNSFIRVSAMLKDNDDPKEINELREWVDFCKASAFDEEGGMMGYAGMGEGMEGEMGIMSGELENRLLSQIRYVSEKHIIAPDVKPDIKAKAEAIVQETIKEFFSDQPFDMTTYKRYNASSKARYADTINNPESGKKYVIELDAQGPMALESLTARLSKGKGKVTVLIDGTPVTGLENVDIDTTKLTAPGYKAVEGPEAKKAGNDKKDVVVNTPRRSRIPLFKNKVKPGSVIEILLTDCDGCEQLSFILSAYLGEY